MLYIIQMAITIPTGILFIVFGLTLAIKQKIDLIHDYHHRNVKERDVKTYTKIWGVALTFLGGLHFLGRRNRFSFPNKFRLDSVRGRRGGLLIARKQSAKEK